MTEATKGPSWSQAQRRRNRENANVFSRSDHAAGERCRASAAVLCRSVGFTLDVDYSPNDAFRVVLLTPPGSSCSIQIGNGLTDAPVGSVRNVYLVITTSRPRGAACSTVGSKSVRSGTRRLLEPGTEVSRSGLTPRAETMLASPTSPIRMATAGCYRNGATAMSEVVWKLSDVEHTRRSRNIRGESSWIRFSRSYFLDPPSLIFVSVDCSRERSFHGHGYVPEG